MPFNIRNIKHIYEFSTITISTRTRCVDLLSKFMIYKTFTNIEIEHNFRAHMAESITRINVKLCIMAFSIQALSRKISFPRPFSNYYLRSILSIY